MTSIARALDGIIDTAIAEERIVGTHVILLEDGRELYNRAAGLADREAGRPIGARPLFRLASVTKPMVAVAALALVERGRLDLDDPVTQYLPAFRPRLADGSEPIITIRHLLGHTSGLTYDATVFGRPGEILSDGIGRSRATMADNLPLIALRPLAFAPGTNWAYGLGIDVIGGVLEQVTGRTLPEVVTELVTAPLGMAETAFHVVDRDRLATPYGAGRPPGRIDGVARVTMPDGGVVEFWADRCFDPHVMPSGGAGMIGSAPDFARFLEAMRRGGAPVLSERSWPLIADNHIGTWDTGKPGRGFSLAWSILWDAVAAGWPASVGTWAWGGIYGHQWWVDPTARRVLVAFTNCAAEGNKGQFPNDVLRAGLTP